MDTSRRAVESYWRSRMIDGATSDEDKVTPVYKLDEICELLRSSHVSIVKEVSEFILKRLEHKSPVVKQKALRLIKYAVGKSGVEFRREMQRHSVAVQNLFHYKGQQDPLKGDALNKAVREMAHEALTAIFASEDSSKPAPNEELGGRIQGFGNTNFEPSDDKKSFLSEVVELGSATIKQGISSLAKGHGLSGFAQGQMPKKTDNGSYRGPNLRRSLTTEIDYSDNRYEPVKEHYQSQSSFGGSGGSSSGPWNAESRVTKSDTIAEESSSSYSQSKTREERLLDTIVTTGGVRLQPTRDAIQVFLVEAAKVDAVALSHALESKLQSPQWQVRVKAICVLDAILRKKDHEHFSVIESYFIENKEAVIRCCESPQASLREKAVKVLNLLGGEQTGGHISNSEKQIKTEANFIVDVPDLIDTGDPDDFSVTDSKTNGTSENNGLNVTTSHPPLIDDLFGDSLVTSISSSDQQNEDDPFADVSFHNEGNKDGDDLFSGMTVDNKRGSAENQIASSQNRPELLDILGSSSETQQHENQRNDVDNLMIGLSIDDKQKENASQAFSGTNFVDLNSHPISKVPNDALSGLAGNQGGLNSNALFASSTLPYSVPPGFLLNPAFASQPINYGPMGSYFAQQQLLATMSNFQHFGNMGSQSAGLSHLPGTKGGNSTPLPDIFQPNLAPQVPSSLVDNSKKEETRAFDFISDHIAAARDPKRVA